MRFKVGRLVPPLLCTILGVTSEPARGASNVFKTKTPESPRPSAPPADVSLAIEAPTARGPWTMRVTNDGDVPVTIIADARLLMLDVTPRGARKASHCELPSEMRPQDDLGRAVILPPKRSYAERLEPRMYCLEPGLLDALAPGAVVVARLGWPGTALQAPVEVAPVEGMEAQVAPSKAVASAPIVLPDERTPALSQRDTPGTPALRVEGWLSLQTARSVDAVSRNDIAIPLTLVNRGHRATIVRFRPETLAFEVRGPGGTDHCAWSTLPSAPTRDLFTTLAPGASLGLTVMLADFCPTRVLEQTGFYVVRASLDGRGASGAEIGIRSFDGQVIAATPTVVRLRHGGRPEPVVRPRLQPVAP